MRPITPPVLITMFAFCALACEESPRPPATPFIPTADSHVRPDADMGPVADVSVEEDSDVQADGATPYGDPGRLAPSFENVHTHIIVPGCSVLGCHDNASASGELALAESMAAYTALFEVRPTNPVAAENGWLLVRPNDTERSFLMRKLMGPGLGEGDAMPSPAQALRRPWLDLLERWIEAGAPPPGSDATELLDPLPLYQARAATELTFRDPIRACIRCHPTHVREWQISNHAYATVDPVFRSMLALGQKQSQGRLGQFCIQCHSPPGLALGETPVEERDGIFVQDLSGLTNASRRGVSCDVCHSITSVNEPRNARVVYTPDGNMRGSLEDPRETMAHTSSYSELHTSSDLCGSCHNVTNPAGAAIEETYDEWAQSDFAQTKTCQDCHMTEYEGRAAVDGPNRIVHRHTFVGVDVSLLPPEDFPGYTELRSRTTALLRESAELSVHPIVQDGRIVVEVRNLAGHSLPSGATAERQMWIEILVFDSDREIQFETGTLDDRGDLRENHPTHTLRPGSDPQLKVWRQVMYGNEGKVEFPWQAKRVENTLIEAGSWDQVDYVVNDLLPGEYTVQVRLLFRTFPPYFLRLLEETAALDPAVKTRVPIVEMASVSRRFVYGEDSGFGDGLVLPCSNDSIRDCDGVCRPYAWRGDGNCDDGRNGLFGGAHFLCAEHDFDQGDCQGDPQDGGCAAGTVRDCSGTCWTSDWLADGWCDDGTQQEWGNPNFACPAYRWDRGDCIDPEEPPVERPPEGEGQTDEGCLLGFLRDCRDRCQPEEWLGDFDCDDGQNEALGHPDFNCDAFANDNGDCR